MNARMLFNGVALLASLTTVAVAQTPSTPKKPPVQPAAEKSLGSAHATESVTVSEPAPATKNGNMQSVSSNPLYQHKGMAGENPLHESKEKQAAPKPNSSHDTVEYKDPEDMTTRYRPGNNKTSKIKPAGSTATTPPSK